MAPARHLLKKRKKSDAEPKVTSSSNLPVGTSPALQNHPERALFLSTWQLLGFQKVSTESLSSSGRTPPLLSTGPRAFPTLVSKAASPKCLHVLSPMSLRLWEAPTSGL